jgi:hypothetical protein
VQRSAVIGIAVVATLTFVGLRALVSRVGSSAAEGVPQVTTPVPPSTVDGTPVTTDEHGVPGGWSHDADGAVSAAVSAVRLTGPIARAGFITRSDMIATIASERYGPTLASESASQLSEMTAVLGAASIPPGDLVWSELPLTATVVLAGGDAARVEVWSILVIGVLDVGAPRQAWRTVTVDLIWEDSDWKIDGWNAAPGPTPLLDATTEIATTQEINDVAAWPPVGGT